MHLLFVLRGRKSKAIEKWPLFWRSVADVLFVGPRDCFYNFRRDDLRVFFSDCFCTIRDQLFKTAKTGAKRVIKAACHVHSHWSYDGSCRPRQNSSCMFAPRGHGVLLMTEHYCGFSQDRLLDYRKACAQEE